MQEEGSKGNSSFREWTHMENTAYTLFNVKSNFGKFGRSRTDIRISICVKKPRTLGRIFVCAVIQNVSELLLYDVSVRKFPTSQFDYEFFRVTINEVSGRLTAAQERILSYYFLKWLISLFFFKTKHHSHSALPYRWLLKDVGFFPPIFFFFFFYDSINQHSVQSKTNQSCPSINAAESVN